MRTQIVIRKLQARYDEVRCLRWLSAILMIMRLSAQLCSFSVERKFRSHQQAIRSKHVQSACDKFNKCANQAVPGRQGCCQEKGESHKQWAGGPASEGVLRFDSASSRPPSQNT